MSLPKELPEEASNYLSAIFSAMQSNCDCTACMILKKSAKTMIEKASVGIKPKSKQKLT